MCPGLKENHAVNISQASRRCAAAASRPVFVCPPEQLLHCAEALRTGRHLRKPSPWPLPAGCRLPALLLTATVSTLLRRRPSPTPAAAPSAAAMQAAANPAELPRLAGAPCACACCSRRGRRSQLCGRCAARAAGAWQSGAPRPAALHRGPAYASQTTSMLRPTACCGPDMPSLHCPLPWRRS